MMAEGCPLDGLAHDTCLLCICPTWSDPLAQIGIIGPLVPVCGAGVDDKLNDGMYAHNPSHSTWCISKRSSIEKAHGP